MLETGSLSSDSTATKQSFLQCTSGSDFPLLARLFQFPVPKPRREGSDISGPWARCISRRGAACEIRLPVSKALRAWFASSSQPARPIAGGGVRTQIEQTHLIRHRQVSMLDPEYQSAWIGTDPCSERPSATARRRFCAGCADESSSAHVAIRAERRTVSRAE